MKRALTFLIAGYFGLSISAQAILYGIDISPAAGDALNLGSTIYGGDHALGIAGPNAVTPGGAGTGGEVPFPGGVFFETAGAVLAYDFAYGSDFGFVDLTGNFSNVHIHGPELTQFPAANGPGAGIQVNIAGDHVAGSSARTGRITGVMNLTTAEEAMLFNNELYINIHSSSFPGGEIRGQLVVVPEPMTLALTLLGLAVLRWRHSRLQR